MDTFLPFIHPSSGYSKATHDLYLCTYELPLHDCVNGPFYVGPSSPDRKTSTSFNN